MYCKYCGKELKDGARFCDRCGQSVRKAKESSQAARHREAEELKAERLNRKKRMEEKEARQKEIKNKKRNKRRGGGVVLFIIVIILIAALSVIIGYNIFNTDTGTGTATETATPLRQEEKNAAATAATAEKYSEITVGSITIPYPADFYTNTASGNEKLNIVDSLGGAAMIVAQEARNGEITELIKEYIASIGANDSNDGPEMRAGSDWYSVTAAVEGKVYHRKCIVRNGLAVYYDFTYNESSTSAKKYGDYIKHIDANFK